MLFCTLEGAPIKQPYVRAWLRRIGIKAGVDKRLHFHGFRHSYASELSSEGVEIRKIQRLLGHESLQTTQRYLDHVAPHELLEVADNRPEWKDNVFLCGTPMLWAAERARRADPMDELRDEMEELRDKMDVLSNKLLVEPTDEL